MYATVLLRPSMIVRIFIREIQNFEKTAPSLEIPQLQTPKELRHSETVEKKRKISSMRVRQRPQSFPSKPSIFPLTTTKLVAKIIATKQRNARFGNLSLSGSKRRRSPGLYQMTDDIHSGPVLCRRDFGSKILSSINLLQASI